MNISQFLKKAKEIRLEDHEKSAIKQSVWNFIAEHPLKSNVEAESASFRNIFSMFSLRLNFSSLAMALLLVSIVGGGVAIGAEKSLPGDALYPIKVNVSEEVQGWLKVSDEGQAEWEIERIRRRLKEAEGLEAEGLLKNGVKKEVELNLDLQISRVKSRINSLKDQDNLQAATDANLELEKSLDAHEEILSRLMLMK